MKTLVLIIALAVIGLACSTQTRQTITFDPNTLEKNISQRMLAEPTPLPSTTPFDSHASEREAYINGYRKAWDYVASGYFLHATIGVTKPAGFEKQWDAGWKTGSQIAFERWKQEAEELRLETNSKPNASP